MLKKGLIVAIAGIVAIVLAVGGGSEPVEVAEAGIATCAPPSPSAGSAPAELRGGALHAGSVTVPRRPLGNMVESGGRQLTTRMAIRVTGHRYLVLSVPLSLRKRVFLYYGGVLDNEGHPTTSLLGAPGYGEIEFQPCPGRRRTVWSGGIRVIGRRPVRLLVTIEGQPTSIPLWLGRPAVAAGH